MECSSNICHQLAKLLGSGKCCHNNFRRTYNLNSKDMFVLINLSTFLHGLHEIGRCTVYFTNQILQIL